MNLPRKEFSMSISKEEEDFGHKWFASEREKKLKHGREMTSKWYVANPSYSKYYYECHQEECSKRSKGYYASHKEEYIVINKEYRKNNPEYKAKWRAEHPGWDSAWQRTEKGKAANQRLHSKRRTRESKILNTLTSKEWLDILQEYNYKCAYCGCELNSSNPPERDHIVPISKGGNNTKENIVPACRSCNARKGDR